jgi:hypothetical protein
MHIADKHNFLYQMVLMRGISCVIFRHINVLGALVQNISIRFINMPKYLHRNHEVIVDDNEMICTCRIVTFIQIALRDALL